MNAKDIRWKQRFENLAKAMRDLTSAIEQKTYTKLELAGVIQTFEFTFELAWKTTKDYLEAEGYIATTPREVIKQAYQINLIKDGTIWLEALEKRNLAAHTYDEKTCREFVKNICEVYYFILKDLYDKLHLKL